MQRQFAIAGANAKSAPRAAGTMYPRQGYIIAALRRIFPSDTVKSFAQLTGISLGAANKKIYGERIFSADELAVLLRTEDGFEFLTAVMADAQPKWWRLCSAYMEVREAQRLQAEARTRLRRAVRGALNADTDLTASIARAEAFSDSEFYQPHADALRAVAGTSDQPVASTEKRK